MTEQTENGAVQTPISTDLSAVVQGLDAALKPATKLDLRDRRDEIKPVTLTADIDKVIESLHRRIRMLEAFKATL